MKPIFICLFLVLLVHVLQAQPTIGWQRSFGGTNVETAWHGASLQQTIDGGSIFIGSTYSNDGDVSDNNGQHDAWIIKLSSIGTISWQKCLGGTSDDFGYSIKQTTDGGFIITGSTRSNNGNVNGNHGNSDAWVVKLNSTGLLQWQKCLGGTKRDEFNSIKQTNDGGYIVTGSTGSKDGDVIGNHGSTLSAEDFDVWLVKLNAIGNIEWQQCFGGSWADIGYSILQTTDGGFIFSGISKSDDHDVSGNHGQKDIWIVKLNPIITLPAELLKNSINLQISPNPAAGAIKMKTDAALMGKPFQVFNALGRLVMSGQITAEEMPLSTEDLPTGIFTIVASGQVSRLVKE